MTAAQHFFAAALEVAGQAPEGVTSDEHEVGPRAIREIQPCVCDHEARGGTGAWDELRERLRAGFDKARGQ